MGVDLHNNVLASDHFLIGSAMLRACRRGKHAAPDIYWGEKTLLRKSIKNPMV